MKIISVKGYVPKWDKETDIIKYCCLDSEKIRRNIEYGVYRRKSIIPQSLKNQVKHVRITVWFDVETLET